VCDLAHRAEAALGVVADELVEFDQFFVGEVEIGF
jgi:hypothetical protein